MNFKEVNKTENVGTIEYAIKHPEEFIMMNENVENSDNDWLYYNEPEPAGISIYGEIHIPYIIW